MLTNLHVKNLALIEEADIEWGPGLNIMTGETGAGKSIVIDSINYCLGEKAGSEVIRTGAAYALTELTFLVDDAMADKLRKLDYPVEDDGTVILSRKIMDARSVFKINGESFTAKGARELAAYLIDIHGQHEHQSLLAASKQKELLDAFSSKELPKLIKEIGDIYSQINILDKEIADFCEDPSAREREISLLEYEINEIDGASLKEGEEEELNSRYKVMQNARRITEELSRALDCLSSEQEGALNSVGYAVKSLLNVAGLDERLAAISDCACGAEQVLSDVCRDINGYLEDFSFEESEFDLIEARIDLINHLSHKYGKDIPAILAYGEEKRNELNKLKSGENYLNDLKNRREELEKKYDLLADKIHDIRKEAAVSLSAEISESLKELNFLKVSFEINVEKKEAHHDGKDEVNFLISLNPGQDLRKLSDVASGGELSRIMLALKEILSQRDNINTLIFDEIDTGISGQTAWQVSKKMGKIAKERQVICITHLPQIAAMADTHFCIKKSEVDSKTVTGIECLGREESAAEIARLLGGETITPAVLANANELMDNAKKVF